MSVDVELKRKRARVLRERVDRTAAEAEIVDEDAEIVLHEERPIVAKETVAKERVRLETDVESERPTVSNEVRKEHVEIEGDDELSDRL